MISLSTKQLKDYEDDGFVAPVDVLTLEEAKKVKEEIDPIAKVELNPKFEGRQMIMVLAPR